MKNKFTHNLLGKAVSGLLAVLFIVCAVWMVDVNGTQVEAATGTETVDYVVESYSYAEITEFRVKDKNGNYGIPTCASDGEWVFAGWFKNEACTSALSSGESPASGTTYYAKFVSADVLSVKCQMTSGTEPTSPNTVLRCVSSVDSLRYKSIGFDLVTPSGTKYMESTKVGTRINAKEGTDAYSYSPKVVDTESEYFYSAVETIEQDNFGKGYIVKPYWITKDGTKVYGVSRYVTVNEYIEKNIMYIPVKMATAPTSTAVTANGSNLTYVTYDADSGYAHFSLAVNTSSLKSVTTYAIAGTCDDKTVDASFSYRNLGTKYQGNDADIDDSWYNSEEDEFVIATSADLYGLAKVVNAGTDSFANKSVYVVCDIEVNKGYADHDNLAWDTSKDADGNVLPTGTTGTKYAWTKIGVGANSGRFAGIFDGQMHTISGIYMDADATKSGLFAEIGGNAVLKDFKLTNSYFNVNGIQYAGSIVGYVYNGKLDSIYSDALVLDGKKGIGGLCGSVDNGAESFIMNNCWFNGAVTASDNWFGGLVGSIGTSGSAASGEITNCLNTGLVEGTDTTSRNVGGLFGYSYAAANALVIKNSMNTGVINNAASNTDNQAKYFLIGNYGKAPTYSNLYATYESGASVISFFPGLTTEEDNVNAGIVYIDDATNGLPIAGTKALTANTKNLFTYVTDADTYANESYWAIAPNGAPVLSDFAKDAKIEDAQAVDTSWYNKNNSSFTLKDAADFYGFALLSRDSNAEGFDGKTVKLGADIVINKGISYSEEYENGVADGVTPIEWLPIGTSSTTTYFRGTFNGQGNNISGIYLNATDDQNGLFRMTFDAVVKNFSLTNSFINGGSQIGSIAGRACSGTFDTIYSSAIVKASGSQIGGIVGHMEGGTTNFIMNNCWFSGTVSSSNNSIGGLIGRIYPKTGYTRTVTNSLNTGDVIANTSAISHVGGLVGYSNCTSDALTISNCLNTGEIGYDPEVTKLDTYGLIGGTLSEEAVHNVYTTSQTDVSYIQGGTNTTYTLDATTIAGTDAMEQLSGFYDLATVDGKHKVYWAVTDTTPILGDFIEFAKEGVAAVAFDTSWYDGSKNYTLYDESDLYGFAKLSEVEDFAEETVKLGADITIPNSGEAVNWAENAPLFNWLSIGTPSVKFSGIFNGQGHEISGVYLKTTEIEKGLFGFTYYDVLIQNFSLTNSYFESSNIEFGSIVGRASGGTFDSIYSNAIVKSGNQEIEKMYLGGLIGRMQGSNKFTMNNCWFDGSVTNTSGSNYIGGLIGYLHNASGSYTRTITNCLNTGVVTAESSESQYVGGLIGCNESGKALTLTNCLNAKEIQFDSSVLNTEDLLKTSYYGLIAGQLQNNTTVEGVYTIAQTGVSNVGNEDKVTSIKAYTPHKDASAISYIDAMNNIPTLFAYKDISGVYKNYWALTDGTPILTTFDKYVDGNTIKLDTSWYNDTDNTFTLSDTADFYGFALLSRLKDIDGFVGKNVNLDKNITIYSTGADGWADGTNEAPFYQWPGIGTSTYPFNGTFNGNKNTIKGIYMNSDTEYSGLFNYTGTSAVIQDFSLSNSYFTSSANYLGSVQALEEVHMRKFTAMRLL